MSGLTGLFAAGWHRPKDLLDFDLLGPIIGHMTMYSVASYSLDVLDWHLLSHWLPVVPPEAEARIKQQCDFHQVKVKHIPLLADATPLIMFEWPQKLSGITLKILATQQEYDALKELGEICTHFYGTWQIMPSFLNGPHADQKYYMRGIIRKSDEELNARA